MPRFPQPAEGHSNRIRENRALPTHDGSFAVSSTLQNTGVTPVPIALRVFNLIAIAIFALFSWLQWNDLDPAIYDHPSLADAISWGLFYALIAALFIFALFRPLPRWVLIVAASWCLIEMGRTAPGLWENLTGEQPFTITQASMTAQDPRVERSREFFGALIALAGVGVIAWESRRFGKSTTIPHGS